MYSIFTVRCGILGFPIGNLHPRYKYQISQKIVKELLTDHSKIQLYRFIKKIEYPYNSRDFYIGFQDEFKKCLLIEISSLGRDIRIRQGMHQLRLSDRIIVSKEDMEL